MSSVALVIFATKYCNVTAMYISLLSIISVTCTNAQINESVKRVVKLTTCSITRKSFGFTKLIELTALLIRQVETISAVPAPNWSRNTKMNYCPEPNGYEMYVSTAINTVATKSA